jgi:hypothetical protein
MLTDDLKTSVLGMVLARSAAFVLAIPRALYPRLEPADPPDPTVGYLKPGIAPVLRPALKAGPRGLFVFYDDSAMRDFVDSIQEVGP